MNTRYISADDAIYELKRAFPVEDFNKIIRVISRTPTADVVERKNGRWIELDGTTICSACGLSLEDWIQAAFYNYCPNCGARMVSK